MQGPNSSVRHIRRISRPKHKQSEGGVHCLFWQVVRLLLFMIMLICYHGNHIACLTISLRAYLKHKYFSADGTETHNILDKLPGPKNKILPHSNKWYIRLSKSIRRCKSKLKRKQTVIATSTWSQGYTKSELHKLQLDDSNIGKVLRWLESTSQRGRSMLI